MTENTSDFKREFSEPTKEHLQKEGIQNQHLKFVGKPQNCCICLVAMIESTELTTKIPDSKTSIFYSTFLNNMADIVEKNNGKIVKSIGDALLFYFDESLENYLRATLRCGLEMVEKRDKINAILNDNDLPSIYYRVSSDYGKVMIGHSSTSLVDDIFGTAVNMCSKINHLANLNGMVIGSDFHHMAKSLKDFQFNEIKNNLDIGLKIKYPVYDVKRN